MKFSALRPTLNSIGRALRLTADATALNMSVLFLELRLGYAKWQLRGFLGAIGTARERMHAACRNDANVAFHRILGGIPIDSLGLQPNIVHSLEWADIRNLRELGDNRWRLQSIPNIGPMREQLIEKAYTRRLEKAAVESCHTIVIMEEIRNHIAFRNAMHAIKEKFEQRREAIRARADDYYAISDEYCEDEGYREEAKTEKERLWADADAFLSDMRAELKKAEAGQATVILMPTQDRTFQSMAAAELSQITFTLSCGFFQSYRIRSGKVL